MTVRTLADQGMCLKLEQPANAECFKLAVLVSLAYLIL